MENVSPFFLLPFFIRFCAVCRTWHFDGIGRACIARGKFSMKGFLLSSSCIFIVSSEDRLCLYSFKSASLYYRVLYGSPLLHAREKTLSYCYRNACRRFKNINGSKVPFSQWLFCTEKDACARTEYKTIS